MGNFTAFAFLLVTTGQAETPPEAAEVFHFECDAALLMPHSNEYTVAAPVTIDFVRAGDELRDIRVVDKGLFFPGGSMRMVHTGRSILLAAIDVPAERPGVWASTIGADSYNLKLTSENIDEAVTITLSRNAGRDGRYAFDWSAVGELRGSGVPSKQLTASGIGACRLNKSNGANE